MIHRNDLKFIVKSKSVYAKTLKTYVELAFFYIGCFSFLL